MPGDRGTMRRDILSAYLASGARVLSWVIVSALVYRASTEAFAMLALVRGTIGILNYAALGLLPAMIRAFAAAPPAPAPVMPVAPLSITRTDDPIRLAYVTPQTARGDARRRTANADADEQTQRVFATG